jgi:hypothetical protein
MGLFFKFCGMIKFVILVQTNYEKWSGDELIYFISQTKQNKMGKMSSEWEDNRLGHFLNQTPW